jgi:chromosome segregation ATPase
MSAEINELFEVGITRCGELTDAADEAMDAIDGMAKEAEQLVRRVEDTAGRACDHMRQLAGRLAQDEDRLTTGRSAADSALEGLAARAAEVKDEAGELLERVRSAVDAIDARSDEIDTALEGHVASTEREFDEVAQATQAAQAAAEQDLQEATQKVAALRAAIEAARAEFAGKQQAWRDAMEMLETTVQDEADEWLDAVNALLRRQAQALVGAANGMVDEHNRAMEAVMQRFAERGPQDLADTLAPLEAALTAAGVSAAEHEQRVSSEADRLAARAGAVLPALAQVDAALAAVAGLE